MGRKRKGSPPKESSITKRAVKQIEPMILEFLNQAPGRGYQIKQILKGLGIRDAKSKGIVSEVIFKLEDTGKIKKLRNGSFMVEGEQKTISGTVDNVNARFAYVVPDGTEDQDDIWVAKNDLLGAFDDDKVRRAQP